MPTIIRFAPPPHGYRLLTLLQVFGKTFNDFGQRATLYDELLYILNPNLPESSTSNAYQEGRSAYETLYCALMTSTADRAKNKAAALLQKSRYFRRIRHLCLNTASPNLILKLGKAEAPVVYCLLLDLSQRPVAYQDSLLYRLEALYQAAGNPDFDPMDLPLLYMEVVWKILADSAIHDGSENPGLVAGVALQEEKLWRETLVKCWLQSRADDPKTEIWDIWTLEHAGDFAIPELNALAVKIFYGYLREADIAMGRPAGEAGNIVWRDLETISGDFRHAEDNLLRAEEMLYRYAERLEQGLPRYPAPSFRETLLPQLADAKLWQSGLAVQLLLRQAALYLRLPDGAEEARNGIRLMRVRNALLHCGNILRRSLTEQQMAERLEFEAHRLNNPETYCLVCLPALVRTCLLEAETSKALALLEKEEKNLGDMIERYIIPCRESFAEAGQLLDHMEGDPAVDKTEFHVLKKRWHAMCQEYFHFFFDEGNPIVDCLWLRPGNEASAYRAESANWRKGYGTPVILKKLRESEVDNANTHTPLYSGVFDSVAGKNPAHREGLELTCIQQVASGNTIILQMNQIVDNPIMLSLLALPGFQWLCRKGVIALSCFTLMENGRPVHIDSPRDYLLRSLRNPNFEFSSTDLYNLPADMTIDEALESKSHPRGVLYRYLTQDGFDIYKFPSIQAEYREELEYLMDRYQILFECFQPSDLLRYHQDKRRRWPSASLPEPKPLSRVIRNRVELLTADAAHRDGQMMEAFDGFVKRWGMFDERSDYRNAANAALRETIVPSEQHYLRKFLELVDDCYMLANGGRSSSQVMLVQNDPDLLLHEDPPVGTPTEGLPSYVIRQIRRSVDTAEFGWPDVGEIAMICRAVVEEGLPSDQQAAKLERETGFSYTDKRGHPLLSGVRVETSEGIRRALLDAEGARPFAENEVVENQEIHRAG